MRRRPISGWGAAVVLCAGLSGCSHDHRVAAPVLGPHDGLPASLVSGEHYTATFTATFPTDWPSPDARSGVPGPTHLGATSRGIVDGKGLGNPEVAFAILCSEGQLAPAGTTVKVVCPFVAPSAGPFEITFGVSSEAHHTAHPTHVFHHTIS